MENKQSNSNPARAHLADERTYLAWSRTSVALPGFGILIVRLRYLVPSAASGHSHSGDLVLVFGVAGLLVVILATSHYFQVQEAIESDTYESETYWIIVCSTVITLVGAGVLYYFLAP